MVIGGNNTIYSLDKFAKYNKVLTTLKIYGDNTIKSLDEFAKYNTALTTLEIDGDNTIKSLDEFAKYNTALTTLFINQNKMCINEVQIKLTTIKNLIVSVMLLGFLQIYSYSFRYCIIPELQYNLSKYL